MLDKVRKAITSSPIACMVLAMTFGMLFLRPVMHLAITLFAVLVPLALALSVLAAPVLVYRHFRKVSRKEESV